MLKFLSILIISLTAFSSFASEGNFCTAWTKQETTSCIFASSGANLYKRQCENPCRIGRNNSGNMGPGCDQEEVCHFNNPDTFEGVCSDWVKDGGANCFDPSTQSWEQQWVRACTIGLAETWCSRQKPF